LRRGHIVFAVGLAATGLLVQGCVTAMPVVYGPIGPEAPHGYRDRQNPDGGYTILVAMPGYSSTAELRAFFDRRAGELCPGGVERANVFRLHASEYYSGAPYVYGSAGVSSRSRVGVELEGYVYCKPGSDAPRAATTPG
jgi:hypothetical protein